MVGYHYRCSGRRRFSGRALKAERVAGHTGKKAGEGMATVNIAIKIWRKHETVSLLLRKIARHVHEGGERRLIPEKLSSRQHDMLIAVSRLCEESPRGVSLRSLAGEMGVSSATASVMADTLVTQGLLRRDTDPDDRRLKRIRLSPRAEELFANGEAAIQEIILRVSRNFEPDYLDQWHDILRRFEQQLKKYGAD